MTHDHVTRLGHIAKSVTTPTCPPIYQTAAFDVPDLDVLHAMIRGEAHGHIYTRDSNPNHQALAEAVAALEHLDAGAVFSSGMGAIACVLLGLAAAGDHVIISRSLYGRTLQLAAYLERRFGIAVTTVDVQDPSQFRAAATPKTRFALIESISNPLLDVADIAAIADALGPVPLVVDNTFTTPELIQPALHGAAVVIHSASKYLNGHGDVMLGVAAASAHLIKKISEAMTIFGINANPFESWLCLRGLRTLPLRMQQICATTVRLAEFLHTHPAVRKTHHPLLPDHPQHTLATQLYPQGTGGIIAFELRGGGQDAVSRFMRYAHTIPFSPTLADTRTTLSHPASTSHRYMTESQRAAAGITDELIRLSVGLEPFELLRDELDAALRAVVS